MDGMSKDNENNRPPEGLMIRRQGESLETVSSKRAVLKLLNTGTNFELTEVTLEEGTRITFMPSGIGSETYYILSGQLSYSTPVSDFILEANDYIITKSLQEVATATALMDTKLLYTTERPQFHTLSEDLNQLRELAVEVEIKDGYTANHCKRLQDLSYALGKELGLESGRLYLLDYGAYLHDVGKIRVPLAILNKPAKLTPEEWNVIKKHPVYGRELLEKTFMKEAGNIVEQHHERLDGSGYPKGLSGDDILIESFIVAVADTFDAMTTNRPYRKASTQTKALAEIHKYAGVHYPKEVVKAFCSAIRTNKSEKRN